MANNIFVYWLDELGSGDLTIIVGTRGGAFANKNCLQVRAFDNIFQVPGICPGVCPGAERCSRLELTCTLVIEYLFLNTLSLYRSQNLFLMSCHS